MTDMDPTNASIFKGSFGFTDTSVLTSPSKNEPLVLDAKKHYSNVRRLEVLSFLPNQNLRLPDKHEHGSWMEHCPDSISSFRQPREVPRSTFVALIGAILH